jgi:hypothetical protein
VIVHERAADPADRHRDHAREGDVIGERCGREPAHKADRHGNKRDPEQRAEQRSPVDHMEL